MAKPKKKKNVTVIVKQSELKRMKSDIIDAAYKTFMAIALTVALDKHDAESWIMDYVHEMNSLLQEVNADKVSVDDLAGVLEDEYNIVLDYKEVQKT